MPPFFFPPAATTWPFGLRAQEIERKKRLKEKNRLKEKKRALYAPSNLRSCPLRIPRSSEAINEWLVHHGILNE